MTGRTTTWTDQRRRGQMMSSGRTSDDGTHDDLGGPAAAWTDDVVWADQLHVADVNPGGPDKTWTKLGQWRTSCTKWTSIRADQTRRGRNWGSLKFAVAISDSQTFFVAKS